MLWDFRKGRNYSCLGQVVEGGEELLRLCSGLWVLENPSQLDEVLRDRFSAYGDVGCGVPPLVLCSLR